MRNYFYHLFVFSILSFSFISCKKDKDPTKNATLPPATQEGKNTVGFTISGEVWVPYYKCKSFGDPCGEISATYSTPSAAPSAIGFQFARERKSKSSSLTLSSSGIGTITTTGNKIDSIAIIFRSETSTGNSGYYTGPVQGSRFVITKIDIQTQIISGEFEFILLDRSGNTITLKDGRFDFTFNACHCSN